MNNLLNLTLIFTSIIMRGIICLYQTICSPLLPATCRYWPSCSQYATTAIKTHGPVAGGSLALKRIGRCHPWSDWGYDPVPEKQLTNYGTNRHDVLKASNNTRATNSCSRGQQS